jgi:aspartate/methionine/tyrosine aminotransferase
VDIDKDWIITGPSMGLLNQTMDCLLEPGKKIAILTPAWEVYFSQISETLATEFAIPMKYSAGHWIVSTFPGKGVDLFLTNDPNNPTSSVFDEKSRQAIISAASETEAPIICDMAYDNLYWDCDFRPLLKYNEVADRVIAFGSFSKSHRMAGWRIGYMLSSNREFLTIMRHKIRKDWTCAPPFTQYAAAYGLSEEFESLEREWCATVRRICMKSVEVLRSFGIECTEPKGTIYVFAKVGVDSVDFSNHLIEAHGIATVPGKYFGGNAVDWLRITPLAVPEDELYPALETIGREYQGALHKRTAKKGKRIRAFSLLVLTSRSA